MGYFCCVIEAFALSANLWLIMSTSVKGFIYKVRVWFEKKHLNLMGLKCQRARAKGKLLRKIRNRKRSKRGWVEEDEDDEEEFEQSEEEEDEDDESSEEENKSKTPNFLSRPKLRRKTKKIKNK
jgi:hypothetical protein